MPLLSINLDSAANMTAALNNCLLPLLQNDVRNVVLNLKDIKNIDIAAAEAFLDLRNLFFTNRVSFVLCELQSSIKKYFEQNEQFQLLQIARHRE